MPDAENLPKQGRAVNMGRVLVQPRVPLMNQNCNGQQEGGGCENLQVERYAFLSGIFKNIASHSVCDDTLFENAKHVLTSLESVSVKTAETTTTAHLEQAAAGCTILKKNASEPCSFKWKGTAY
jgi:hypothetical protein